MIDQFTDSQLERLAGCPWCSTEDASPLFSENGFSYVECRKCTLIYLSVRLKEQYAGLLYEDPAYRSAIYPADAERDGVKRLALLGRLPSDTRVFEDAAAEGAFVAACKRQGLRADGCDPSGQAVRKAKQLFGVELARNTLAGCALQSGSVDVLASFNLLSHLYHPWKYMKEASRLLTPRGVWLLRTGDRSGRMKRIRWGKWSAPEHVFHYNHRVLAEMMEAAGLEMWKIQPAFDCAYPYFLFDFTRHCDGFIKLKALKLCSWTATAWTKLGLPKEDVYIFARRRR